MTASRALDRPRPRRTKHPERWSVEINELNRPILLQMLTLLNRTKDIYADDPGRQKHLVAIRYAIMLLQQLLDTNPRELMFDPDDFVKRSIMLYLDETCWGLILRWTQQQHAYGTATGYGYGSYPGRSGRW